MTAPDQTSPGGGNLSDIPHDAKIYVSSAGVFP